MSHGRPSPLETDGIRMAKTTPRPKAADFKEDLDDDVWAVDEAASPSLAARLSAEFVGSLIFIFIGLSVTLFASQGAFAFGAMAWGAALAGLIVAVGRISGAHFNPAVTVGAWIAGRFPGRDVALYILMQVTGALTAGGLVYWFAGQVPDRNPGAAMSQLAIGTEDHSPLGASISAGIAIEFIATALLVAVILAATSIKARTGQAPFTIGIGITILVLMATPFSNAGLNPARVTASNVFSTDANGAHWALGQLWWWWLVTILAGAFVGLLFRAFGPEDDLETITEENPAS